MTCLTNAATKTIFDIHNSESLHVSALNLTGAITVLNQLLKCVKVLNWLNHITSDRLAKQESPAIADKPARRESLPKIAPIRRAYNVIADNTGLSSFV